MPDSSFGATSTHWGHTRFPPFMMLWVLIIFYRLTQFCRIKVQMNRSLFIFALQYLSDSRNIPFPIKKFTLLGALNILSQVSPDFGIQLFVCSFHKLNNKSNFQMSSGEISGIGCNSLEQLRRPFSRCKHFTCLLTAEQTK